MAQSEQYIFRPIEASIGIWASVITYGRNLVSSTDQAPHYRKPIDNLGIMLNIKGSGTYGYQVTQVSRTAT